MRGHPVSGNSAGLTRPALRMMPDEPGQVLRLQQFRATYPDVIVGKGEFGTWQARIPHLSGETVTIRYTLRELLDRLGELLAENNGAPGGCPPAASPDRASAK
jgi:hypothetical protein